MLPDDQMVRAAWDALEAVDPTVDDVLHVEILLRGAFEALDRDALVDTATDALRSTGIEHALRERAQVVLRAVGLLP